VICRAFWRTVSGVISNRATLTKTFHISAPEARMKLKNTIKEEELFAVKEKTIADMTTLGIYKPEYDTLIDIYVGLIIQYYEVNKVFVDTGSQYEVDTERAGTKKSGLVSAMENLRKDIIAYSDRLCLNPKAIENITTQTKNKSKLAQMFEEYDKVQE
jgi:phage terminase small subunit